MRTIQENPLCSRADVETALLQLLEPLESYFTEGDAGLHLGNFGVHYGEPSARVEAFSRPLWGLAPYWAGGGSAWFDRFRRGLVNGTNPAHPAYWGPVFDSDQKIVEMAAISLTLLLCGERLALTHTEAVNLHAWLGQCNGRTLPRNNWHFFRVLVNAAFRRMGWAWDQVQLDADLSLMDSFYLGDGWYCDGQLSQIDYYVPFAMHFYGLIYARFMDEFDPVRCSAYRDRAAQFAQDFYYWFEDGGRAVPFGRSLTYRFGQSAFFSALPFAGVDGLDWGEVKSRVLGNLRDWFSLPILQNDGLLSVGYAYPNLCMSENYNAHGSPYWGLKTFLCLALPEDHPFWTACERPPALDGHRLLPQARALVHRNGGEVQLFPAGQYCHNQLGQCAAKYEKLVYSSRLGFSVSRGTSLEEGAFDSCLAVSEAGENHYRMQRGFDAWEVTADHTLRTYSPMRGVQVTVKVEPKFPGHLRRYTITTDRPIDVADGGFSIPAEWERTPYTPDMVEIGPHSVSCHFPWGESSISCAQSLGEPLLVKAFPNTNLLWPVTRIPTLRFRLEAGTHSFVTAIRAFLA